MPPPKLAVGGTPKNLQDSIVVHGKRYIKLKQIGIGGSGVVYRVINEDNDVLALKCVNLDNISTSQYQDFVNEVKLLEALRGTPGIITMLDYELCTSTKKLYLVGCLQFRFHRF